MPLELVHHARAEVLDDDLGLLRDVRRVQVHEPRERGGGLFLVQGGVVGDGLGQLEEPAVRGVAAQHIENEALLDRLAHRVQMKRRGLAADLVAEHLQRLVFRRRREREEAHVRLRPAKQRRPQRELVGCGQILAFLLGLVGDEAPGEQFLDGHRHLAGL